MKKILIAILVFIFVSMWGCSCDNHKNPSKKAEKTSNTISESKIRRMICTSLVKKQIISDSNYIQILLRSFGDKHIFALPRINGCVNHEKCIIQIKKQEADYPVFFTYKAVVKDIYMYERKE